MKDFLNGLFNHRVRALVRKEFGQIRRDRRLAISLILPPVLQLTLFGFALSATVTGMRLGVVDDCRTLALSFPMTMRATSTSAGLQPFRCF